MSWIETLNLPKACLVQKRIPLKKLGEHCTLRQKQLIEKNISSVMLVALVDEETSRIRSFQDTVEIYQVFFILEIVSKVFPLSQEVYQLLHSLFPNPTILFCEKDDKLQLSSTLKRINLNDSELTTVEEMIVSSTLHMTIELNEYFYQIDYFRLRVLNLKEFYFWIHCAIKFLAFKNYRVLIPKDKDKLIYIYNLETEFSKNNSEIECKSKSMKIAAELSRRMDLHMDIQVLKRRNDEILKEVSSYGFIHKLPI